LKENNIEVREPLWVVRAVDEPGAGEGESLYYGPNWPEQRKAALEKYDYTCQYDGCNETNRGRPLDVHHIKPLRTFDSFEEAHQVDNLVPYCKEHHGKVETHK
jgi:5-methylcytosine-specific restriction endonuclease McrA